MKLLLVVAVLVLLIRGMTAQQVDSNTTCTICTYLLSFNTISSARNSCGAWGFYDKLLRCLFIGFAKRPKKLWMLLQRVLQFY